MLVGINTVQTNNVHHGFYYDRYWRRVLDAVAALETDVRFVVFTQPHNHTFFEGCPRVELPAPEARRFFPKSNTGELARAMAESGADMLVSPLDAAPVRISKPQAVCVLQHASGVDITGARNKNPYKAQKRICATAELVLTTTEYMRKKCLEWFEAPLEKTTVAPPGVSSVFTTPQPSMVDAPFLLTYYDVYTAERVHRLRDVFAKHRGEFSHLLVVAGPGADDEPQDWGEGIVRIEQCPDVLLAGLYQHCAVFLYPAQYDATGMRVLEALHVGANVITPRTGVLEELAGQSPCYYNPGSPGSFLQALRRSLEESTETHVQHARQGRAAVATYTWEKTAWKILSALKKL